MPVEIRELVIQAQLEDKQEGRTIQVNSNSRTPASWDEPEHSAPVNDQEWTDRIVEQCVARLKEWLTEKSMR